MKTEIRKKEITLSNGWTNRIYNIHMNGTRIIEIKFTQSENELFFDYFYMDEEDPELLELFYLNSARDIILEISLSEKYSFADLLATYYKAYINYLLTKMETNNCYMKEEIKANLITKEEILDMGITGETFGEVLGQIISMCRSSLRPLKQYNGCFISIYKKSSSGVRVISQRRIYSIDEREILLTLQFDEKDIQRMI